MFIKCFRLPTITTIHCLHQNHLLLQSQGNFHYRSCPRLSSLLSFPVAYSSRQDCEYPEAMLNHTWVLLFGVTVLFRAKPTLSDKAACRAYSTQYPWCERTGGLSADVASLTSSTAQARLTKRLSRVNWLVLLLHALLAYVSPRIIWSPLLAANPNIFYGWTHLFPMFTKSSPKK